MAVRCRIEARVGGKDVRRRHGVDLQGVDGAVLACSRRAPRRIRVDAGLRQRTAHIKRAGAGSRCRLENFDQ